MDTTKGEFELIPCHSFHALRKPNKTSIAILITCLFLSVSNFYVQIPTGPSYSTRVGLSKAYSGPLLATSNFTMIPFNILWTNLSRSYPFRYVFVGTSLINVVANLFYALAATTDSSVVLFLSRVLLGVGWQGAVLVTFLSKAFGRHHIKFYSGLFACTIAAGIAGGSLVAGILTPIDAHIGRVYFDKDTLPGWFFAFSFAVLTVMFMFGLQEPENPPADCFCGAQVASSSSTSTISVSPEEEHVTREQDSQYRASLIAGFVMLAMLTANRTMQMAFESAAPLIGDEYFSWSIWDVSIFLSAIGLAMLPLFLLQSKCFPDVDEYKASMGLCLLNICGGLVAMQYSSGLNVEQYCIGSFLLFISFTFSYGYMQSLFIKTFPSNFAKGKLDVGTFSMGGASVGRAVGGVFGSQFSGNVYQELIVSAFILGLGVSSVISLAAFYKTFNAKKLM